MPIIIPANSAVGGGFDVANSVRYNSGDSPRLHINALGTATDIDKWTFSCWFKRSKLSSTQNILYAYTSGQEAAILLNSSDQLDWYNYPGSGAGQIITNRLFRDVSAWYHLVCSYDGDNSTAGNRMRIYINGVEETSFATDTNPSSGEDQLINSNVAHNIGLKYSDSGNAYFGGYFAEICFIDGQQLDPTSFGEFDEDSGVWKPIKVSGLTFGNNGFYQEYSNSSALGEDFSGNNKDFTSTNLAAIDQSTDTCTNNAAVFNSIYKSGTATHDPNFSDGNLSVTFDNGNDSTLSTIGVSSGKWYVEFKVTSDSQDPTVGVGNELSELLTNPGATNIGASTGSVGYYSTGKKQVNGTGEQSYGNSFTANDIIGIALDLTNGAVWFSKNGTWQASATISEIAAGTTTNAAATGLSGTFFFGCDNSGGGTTGDAFSVNFGSPPYAVSSGNADGNGYGNFEYTVPSGYFSLNTKNLAEYG